MPMPNGIASNAIFPTASASGVVERDFLEHEEQDRGRDDADGNSLDGVDRGVDKPDLVA